MLIFFPLQRNNSLVWEESQRIVLELLDEEWRGQETVIDENILITSTSVRHSYLHRGPLS